MLKLINKILLLIFIIGIAPVYSQLYNFRYYSVEDGLIMSSVAKIYQDSKGYIWFGTQGGLSRFDGLKFTNYSIEDGLNDKTVLSIVEDVDNTLLIGTKEGINLLKNGKVSNFILPEEFPKNWIQSLYKDKKGNIWIGTRGGGLIKYSYGEFTYYNEENKILKNNFIFSIYQTEDENIWFGTGNGISKYDGVKFTNYTLENNFPANDVRSIVQDKEGTIWFGTAGDGLIQYRKGIFKKFTTANGLTNNIIRSLEIGNHDELIIGTDDGITKLSNGNFITIQSNEGFTGKIVLSIFKDNESNIWFGVYDGGAVLLISEKFAHYNSTIGLSSDIVYSVLKDRNNNYWFGTSNGVTRIKGKTFSYYDTKNGLAGDEVLSIIEDTNGNIWFGTNKGVSVFDGNKFIKTYNDNNGLTDNNIHALMQDAQGLIWLATNYGINIINNNNINIITESNGLPTNKITCFAEDINGNIWIGTQDNGIVKYDKNKFTSFQFVNDTIPIGTVNHIMFDSKGRTWISSDNIGTIIFNEDKSLIINTQKGLSNNVCRFTVEDQFGNIWIATNRGLNKFNEKIEKVYTNKSGLLSNEFNNKAVFKEGDRFIWLGNVKGITRLEPSLDIKNNTPPPVYVTRLQIFENDTTVQSGLILNYKENYLKFEYEGLSYTSPEELIYEFMLEGVDQNWQTSNARNIQYTSLQDGNYKFFVRARNNDGVWSNEPAILSFIIKPPFWETWWFRTISIIILLSSAYGFYLYKTYQIRQRSMELARLVKERTKELEAEKNKSDELLLNILPAEIVRELKAKGVTDPRAYKSISILFTDFVGFTSLSSKLSPTILVKELNEIFKIFDKIIDKYGLEKLKTIGDSYMIGGGLPKESEDHAFRIILTALEMQNYIKERNESAIIKWQMRAGVNSGEVVAGIVGTRKFTYDVWGDTVNIASRMESNCEPGRINISQSTYELVKDYFDCEYRGKISAKGKGEMDMYFIINIKEGVNLSLI